MNRSMTDATPARNVRVDAFVAQMQRTERAELAKAIEHVDMAEIEREAIAARIRQAREEAGLSQTEMAEAIGVIPRTYQNYESLTRPRTPWGSMNDIAKITGKSTEWLIHGDNATPELFAKVSSVGQVDAGFEEFRAYVQELNTKLDDARLERGAIQALIDQQNANLGTQTGVLEKIESALAAQTEVLEKIESATADLPTVANALAVLLQRLEAAGQRQRRAGDEA